MNPFVITEDDKKEEDNIPHAVIALDANVAQEKNVFYESEQPYTTTDTGARYYTQNTEILQTKTRAITKLNIIDDEFPFGVKKTNIINTIQIRGNNIVLQIHNNKIISNKPILIDYDLTNNLKIWEAQYKDEYTLTTTGKSELTGVSVLNFDGIRASIGRKHLAKEWCFDSEQLVNIQSLIVSGKSINITLDNLSYDDKCDVMIKGEKSIMHINNSSFKYLNLTSLHGNITLTNCTFTYVKCELVGNGIINKLNSKTDIKIVGGGIVYVEDMDMVDKVDISGVGEVKLCI